MTLCVTLNNGVKMPVIGYGVYLVNQGICAQCVKDAIQVGYRHIDTAQMYFNEKEVGDGIRLSGIPRNQIFVTTKVCTSGYLATKNSIEESLRKFGFPYFDLILIHWPQADNIGTYKALEEAYKQGKCRAIGLSNFSESDFLQIYKLRHIYILIRKKCIIFWLNIIAFMNLGHLLEALELVCYKIKR